MRQFLSLSLAMLLGLTSANAYTLGPPQFSEQIEAAVLLNEDGTHRCRIGEAPELEDLRECDQNDIHAEEISLGMAAPPSYINPMIDKRLKIFFLSTGISYTAACSTVFLSNQIRGDLILALGLVGIGGGHALSLGVTTIIAAGSAKLTTIGFISSIYSLGGGLFICGDVGDMLVEDSSNE